MSEFFEKGRRLKIKNEDMPKEIELALMKIASLEIKGV